MGQFFELLKFTVVPASADRSHSMGHFIQRNTIKIDENNPESDYERYLFDPKAELKDVPKFLKIKYPRDLSYDKQRPKYKRFMVMKTLKRPKTAAEKDSVIANAMLKDRFHEEGLVDPYNFAERSSKEFWSAGGGENYFKFDAWCGRERPPPQH